MNTLRLLLLSIFIAFAYTASQCWGENAVDTKNGIFASSFKTLKVQLTEDDQLPPMLILGGMETLTVSFDELADDRRYMRYELIHCNANWAPENIPDQMVLDGFNQADVDNFRYSQATAVNYVHYAITLPNDKIRFKISGNYLLRVYDESDPSTTLLQVRFYVCENTVSTLASLTSRTDIDYQKSHHQLKIVVEPKSISIPDPYRDLKIVISQNGRIDNAKDVKGPQRIEGRKLIYEHLPGLIFKAGNEYRRFETITVNYPGMNIEEMSWAYPFSHADVRTDYPRSMGNYTFDKTQQGRFRVRNFDSDDSDTESEYVLTHFTLEMPQLAGREVFLDGDFTYRRFDPSSLMVYNRGKGAYESTQLLKQGAYNYQYLTVPEGSMTGRTYDIEGDFYQTTDEYSIAVYYRKPGELYDRLVGWATLLSNH